MDDNSADDQATAAARAMIWDAAFGIGPLAPMFISFDEDAGTVTLTAAKAMFTEKDPITVEAADLWALDIGDLPAPADDSGRPIAGVPFTDLICSERRRTISGTRGDGSRVDGPPVVRCFKARAQLNRVMAGRAGWYLCDDGVVRPVPLRPDRVGRFMILEWCRQLLIAELGVATAVVDHLPPGLTDDVQAQVADWPKIARHCLDEVETMIDAITDPDPAHWVPNVGAASPAFSPVELAIRCVN